MRIAFALLLLLFTTNAFAADAVVDLMTAEGTAVFQGVWRYSDTRIFMSGGTYDFEPHAGGADFDDSTWEILDPPSLAQPRSTGKVCFNWYRIELTVPASLAGMTLVFEAVVDDYAEVWVNGELPRDLGQSGGSVIKGFNAPNRLIIAENAQPGQKIQIAVFGINGPISDAPGNYIFFRSARVEVYQSLPGRRRGVRGN